MNSETFFDKFGMLADTPNGVQKLRELILQQAVQGKLVPQDENDEPAEVLIEKIRAEKERLVKKKKIKKSKPLPPIENDKIPYAIPNNWKWERLGNIGNATNYPIVDGPFGSSINTKEDYISSGIPVIRMVNVKPFEFINEKLKFIKKEKYKSLERHNILPNDVLLGKVGSIGNSCIFPEYIKHGLLSTTGLCRFRVGNIVIPKYLCYFLNGISPKLKELASTNVQPFLNMNTIKNIQFPIPPLEEQKRIVTKVDQLMAHCDQLEVIQQKKHEQRILLNNASLDKLLTAPTPEEFAQHWQRICDNFDLLYDAPETVGQLRHAILQLAVQGKLVAQDQGDEPVSLLIEKIKLEKENTIKKNKNLPKIQTEEIPYDLPKGWNWIRLGHLGQTQTGTTPSKNNSEFFGKDYPFLKPGDISDNFIDYNNDGLSQLGMKNGRFIKADSILMVCIGGSIGKVNLVDRDCSCNQQINVLKPYLDLDSRLFSYFMRSRYFQNEVKSRAPQTTLPILSKGKWELIPLPLPPLQEQKRIVAKVDQLMALCDELEAGLVQAQTEGGKLMEAVVHHVLAG